MQEKVFRDPPPLSAIPFKQDTAFCLNLYDGKEFCEYFFHSFNMFVNKPPIYSEGRRGAVRGQPPGARAEVGSLGWAGDRPRVGRAVHWPPPGAKC